MTVGAVAVIPVIPLQLQFLPDLSPTAESRKALLSAVARRPEADEAIPKTSSGISSLALLPRKSEISYFIFSRHRYLFSHNRFRSRFRCSHCFPYFLLVPVPAKPFPNRRVKESSAFRSCEEAGGRRSNPQDFLGDFFACFAPSQKRNQLFYFFASPLFIFP